MCRVPDECFKFDTQSPACQGWRDGVRGFLVKASVSADHMQLRFLHQPEALQHAEQFPVPEGLAR